MDSGVCDIPDSSSAVFGKTIPAAHKPVKIIFFIPIHGDIWLEDPKNDQIKIVYYLIISIKISSIL